MSESKRASKTCGVSYRNPDGPGIVTCILPEHDSEVTPHEHELCGANGVCERPKDHDGAHEFKLRAGRRAKATGGEQ